MDTWQKSTYFDVENKKKSFTCNVRVRERCSRPFANGENTKSRIRNCSRRAALALLRCWDNISGREKKIHANLHEGFSVAHTILHQLVSHVYPFFLGGATPFCVTATEIGREKSKTWRKNSLKDWGTFYFQIKSINSKWFTARQFKDFLHLLFTLRIFIQP